MTKRNYLTPEDIADMRKDYYTSLDDLTDDQIIDALGEEIHIIGLAREWGWDDTQVRDDSAELFEKAGYGPFP